MKLEQTDVLWQAGKQGESSENQQLRQSFTVIILGNLGGGY